MELATLLKIIRGYLYMEYINTLYLTGLYHVTLYKMPNRCMCECFKNTERQHQMHVRTTRFEHFFFES